MIDGMPVLDAVIHAYNFNPANYANRFAAPIADLTFHSVTGSGTPGYVMTSEQFYRDCPMEDLTNLVFAERAIPTWPSITFCRLQPFMMACAVSRKPSRQNGVGPTVSSRIAASIRWPGGLRSM